MNLKTIIPALLLVNLLYSCNKDPKTEFYGKEIKLGKGTVKTFFRKDDTGKPLELGVAISENVLSSLPHSTTQHVLDFPKEALQSTPFTFMLFDHNHEGHEPPKIYDINHFDIHFYLTSNEDRLKISPTDTTTGAQPAEGLIPMPSAFAGVVPQMGAHWIDVTSPEFNGGKFTHTFIYGSAFGKVNFLEPMITIDFLNTKGSSTYNIRQPKRFEKPGLYPKKYGIKYKEALRQYEITLESFE